MTKLILNSLSNLSILLVLHFVVEVTSSSVIFDVSGLVKDILSNKPEQVKARESFNLFVSKNEHASSETLLYYESDVYTDLITEAQAVVKLFDERKTLRFRPKLIFSIKDVYGLAATRDVSEYFAGVIDVFLNYTSVMTDVCYNAIWLENNCHKNGENYTSGHATTTIISRMREYVLNVDKSKYLRTNILLGYQLHANYIKCKDHQANKENADFLIVDVPFNRNDIGFVESYGLFKTTLDNEIMPLVTNTSKQKNVFIKVSLWASIARKPLFAFFHHHYKQIRYYQKDQNWLQIAERRLPNIDKWSSQSYQYLLTLYTQQWSADLRTHNTSIILSYLDKYPYFESREIFSSSIVNPKIVPYITNLPISPYMTRLSAIEQEEKIIAADCILKDVASEGFNTIMLTGRSWTEANNMEERVAAQRRKMSRPLNIFYYIEDNRHFKSILDGSNIKLAHTEINSSTVVISDAVSNQSIQHWGDMITKIDTNGKSIEIACQMRVNVLEKYEKNMWCENPIACSAVTVRGDFDHKCKSNITSALVIIWMQTLNFSELEKGGYRSEEFVTNIMQKLDSFLLAREMLLNEYPNLVIYLQFKGVCSGKLSLNNGIRMYCNNYAERIQQFYEAILTWVLIHNFPVIFEPFREKDRYDNPLVWNQLEVSSKSSMHSIMNKVPLFIRRSYSRARVFGWWSDGMYPCISKALVENSYLKLNSFENAGVTIQTDLRNGSLPLNENELQLLLILSLNKFLYVNLKVSSKAHVSLLQSLVNHSTFKQSLKDNLKLNKTIYLQIDDMLCRNQYDLKFTINKLNEAGLNVKIYGYDHTCLRKFVSKDIEIGLLLNNCSANVEKLIYKPENFQPQYNSLSQATFLVCETEKVYAYNRDEKLMQDYLDSHLYLRKLFQYFFPNLKRVNFRLQAMWIASTPDQQIEDFMMFLTEVNSYAEGYNMNYFMGLAFAPQENKNAETSFWKIKNYTDLANISVFLDNHAEYLHEKTWTPKIIVVNTTTPSSSRFSLTNSHLSLGASIVGILALIVIVATVILRRKSKNLTQNEIRHFRKGQPETLKIAVRERQMNQYTVTFFDGLVFQKDFEIPKKDINLNRKIILGKGMYSINYLATINNLNERVCVTVANTSCSKEAFKGIMSEVKLLSYLGDHENVVRFVGCFTEDIRKRILWIVQEYCEGGSLQMYLRGKGNEDIDELIRFSYEIACGMEYIGSQKVVYGDLRTEMVLLNGTNTCKISGCGRLASKLVEIKKCMQKGKETLPKSYQWMAYESLKSGNFSIETDVWSYGVTIWEIFSLGEMPYSDIGWDKLVNSMEDGKRLSRPKLASKQIHDVMQQCWCINAKDRPDISKLVEFFGDLFGQKSI